MVAFEDASVRLKSKHLSFAFVEGELVTAVREGKFEFILHKCNLSKINFDLFKLDYLLNPP